MLDMKIKMAQLTAFFAFVGFNMLGSSKIDVIFYALTFLSTVMLYLNLINSSELNEKYREKYEEAEKNKEKYK